jgi:Spy/CpxP family protein refolding chaperone
MNLEPKVIVAVLLMTGAVVWGQQPPAGGPGPVPQRPSGSPGGDLMAENFFPPELVMQHQKAIELKNDQQSAIKVETQKRMARFTDLQWEQQAEMETLASLVKQEPVDEQQALGALDKLMNTENEIKRSHLELLIKVKNILTPEQQGKLRELRKTAYPYPSGALTGLGPSVPPQAPPQPSSDSSRR